eukprot:jgi/Bigna1/91500/estExt_fgenesh1_pg.C_1030018
MCTLGSGAFAAHSRRFSNLPEFSRILWKILEASGMLSKILEDSRIFRNVLEASGRFSKLLEDSRSSENFHAHVRSAACSTSGRGTALDEVPLAENRWHGATSNIVKVYPPVHIVNQKGVSDLMKIEELVTNSIIAIIIISVHGVHPLSNRDKVHSSGNAEDGHSEIEALFRGNSRMCWENILSNRDVAAIVRGGSNSTSSLSNYYMLPNGHVEHFEVISVVTHDLLDHHLFLNFLHGMRVNGFHQPHPLILSPMKKHGANEFWMRRMQALISRLESLPDSTVVLVQDCLDALVIGTPIAILQRFLKLEKDIVFGAEILCDTPYCRNNIGIKRFMEMIAPSGRAMMKFLNAGNVIARAGPLAQFLHFAKIEMENKDLDDQAAFTNVLFHHGDHNYVDDGDNGINVKEEQYHHQQKKELPMKLKITLDYEAEIFAIIPPGYTLFMEFFEWDHHDVTTTLSDGGSSSRRTSTLAVKKSGVQPAIVHFAGMRALHEDKIATPCEEFLAAVYNAIGQQLTYPLNKIYVVVFTPRSWEHPIEKEALPQFLAEATSANKSSSSSLFSQQQQQQQQQSDSVSLIWLQEYHPGAKIHAVIKEEEAEVEAEMAITKMRTMKGGFDNKMMQDRTTVTLAVDFDDDEHHHYHHHHHHHNIDGDGDTDKNSTHTEYNEIVEKLVSNYKSHSLKEMRKRRKKEEGCTVNKAGSLRESMKKKEKEKGGSTTPVQQELEEGGRKSLVMMQQDSMESAKGSSLVSQNGHFELRIKDEESSLKVCMYNISSSSNNPRSEREWKNANAAAADDDDDDGQAEKSNTKKKMILRLRRRHRQRRDVHRHRRRDKKEEEEVDDKEAAAENLMSCFSKPFHNSYPYGVFPSLIPPPLSPEKILTFQNDGSICLYYGLHIFSDHGRSIWSEKFRICETHPCRMMVGNDGSLLVLSGAFILWKLNFVPSIAASSSYYFPSLGSLFEGGGAVRTMDNL